MFTSHTEHFGVHLNLVPRKVVIFVPEIQTTICSGFLFTMEPKMSIVVVQKMILDPKPSSAFKKRMKRLDWCF